MFNRRVHLLVKTILIQLLFSFWLILKSVEGVKSVIRDTCALVWTWIVIHEGGFKNLTIPIFLEAKLVEILNAVVIYDRRL